MLFRIVKLVPGHETKISVYRQSSEMRLLSTTVEQI